MCKLFNRISHKICSTLLGYNICDERMKLMTGLIKFEIEKLELRDNYVKRKKLFPNKGETFIYFIMVMVNYYKFDLRD